MSNSAPPAWYGNRSGEPTSWRDFLSASELADLERDDETGPEQDEPCRECRGRGYDRRNPDEPCERCAGEGVEL